jgi:hypothetical protein
MALSVEKARSIEREVTIRSSVKGLPNREYLIGLTGSGVTLREKGAREARSLTYRQLIGMMLIHCSEK